VKSKNYSQLLVEQTNDTDFFPLVSNNVKRVGLYVGMWLLSILLIIIPGWVFINLFTSK